MLQISNVDGVPKKVLTGDNGENSSFSRNDYDDDDEDEDEWNQAQPVIYQPQPLAPAAPFESARSWPRNPDEIPQMFRPRWRPEPPPLLLDKVACYECLTFAARESRRRSTNALSTPL